MSIYKVTLSNQEVLRVGAPSEEKAKDHAEKVSAAPAVALGQTPPRATHVEKEKS